VFSDGQGYAIKLLFPEESEGSKQDFQDISCTKWPRTLKFGMQVCFEMLEVMPLSFIFQKGQRAQNRISKIFPASNGLEP